MKNLKLLTILLIAFCITDFAPSGAQTVPQTDNWQECNSSGLNGIQTKGLFPDKSWWEGFGDSKLNDYVSLALANNFSLRAAVDRISEARAVVDEVKSVQRPFIGIQEDYQRIRTSSNVSTQESSSGSHITGGKSLNLYTFPLVASYELDVFGKNRLKVESAKKFEKQIEQERNIIELALVSEVAGAYFNLLQADASIKATENLIDITGKSIQLRQQLFAGGVIPYDTVLLNKQNLDRYRENLAQYKSQRDIFAHQLNILTGVKPVDVGQVERSTIDQIALPKDIPVGIPSQLITHRPDVQAAEAALEKAKIDVKEARREFFPTFDLNGDIGYQSAKLSKLFDWSSRIYQIGEIGFQSLYTGGYRRANLKYQKALMQERLNSYFTVLLSAFGDVENGLALFKNNYDEYKINLSEIDTSKLYLGLAQDRFKSGIGTQIDCLDAQQQLLSYELLAQQNKTRSLIDLVSLYKALGGGYTP